MPQKVSLDELLSKRQGHIKHTDRGDAIVKAVKAPASWDDENRSAKFIMTSESVDRYGDIVVQSGIQTDAFMKNPQGLLFHDSRSWPIGLWSDVTKVLAGRPKRTEGVLNFMEKGLDPDADRAATHVKAGTIRTVSIGFIPLDWDYIEEELEGRNRITGFRFIASELLECSLVPIPAQPDALVKDAGGDNRLLRSLVEEVLDTYRETPDGLIVPRQEYERVYETTVTKKTISVGNAEKSEERPEERAAETPAGPVAIAAADDLQGCAGEVINRLAGRGVVFVTSYKVDSVEFGGLIVAQDLKAADTIADGRGFGEEVLGTLTSVSEIGERAFELRAIDEEVAAEAAAAIAKALEVDAEVTPEGGNITLDLPATTPTVPADMNAPADKVEKIGEGGPDAEAEFDNVEPSLLASIRESMKKIFKRHDYTPPPAPPAPPAPEEIAAAQARAAALRQRLLEKGLA